VVVQQQIPRLQQVRPSNKIEKKSPMSDLVARCGGEAANSSSSEIKNKSTTVSTLSFAPGK